MAWTAPATYSTSEVVTATKLNTNVRDNMKELWHEVAYVEFSANVTLSTVAEASAPTVVSAGAVTFGGYPIIVEFYCPRVESTSAGNNATYFNLWDSATNLGVIGSLAPTVGNQPEAGALFLPRRLTPTAASHTYLIKGFTASGTASTAVAGAGGIGTFLPGYIRILERGGVSLNLASLVRALGLLEEEYADADEPLSLKRAKAYVDTRTYRADVVAVLPATAPAGYLMVKAGDANIYIGTGPGPLRKIPTQAL